jgi:hypothetical protein
MLAGIADALGTTVDELIGRTRLPAALGEPASLDDRRAERGVRQPEELAQQSMSLYDLPAALAETSDRLANAEEAIARLEGERTEHETRQRLTALLAEIVPLLEAFASGRGDVDSLQPRLEALRALARRDRGGGTSR